MIHFLNVLAHISPKKRSEQRQHDHVRFTKQRKPLTVSKVKSDQEIKGVLCLQLTVIYLQVTQSESGKVPKYKETVQYGYFNLFAFSRIST